MLDGLFDPTTFWLTVTNLAFGVFIGACLVVTLVGVGWAVFGRARAWLRGVAARDLHTLEVRGLGTTMADGGEPIDPKHRSRRSGR